MKPPVRKALRWQGFSKNIFSEITDLARREGAVNLAQGFPDCAGAPRVLEALVRHLTTGHNQYASYIGEECLRLAIAAATERSLGISYNPDSEITVTAGATEAIYSVVNAFVNPGDRVLVFEPCYDSYLQAIANAGGVVVPLRLHAPDTPLGIRSGGWAVDWEAFDTAVSQGFSLLILNTPHNPTGRLFSRDELERVASAVVRQGAVVLSDEVYEHLVFDGGEHVSPASLSHLRDSVVRVSSVAKTFGFTGFKAGWVTAPAALTEAVRLVHQAVVFCIPPHIQRAFAELLADASWMTSWSEEYLQTLARRRQRLWVGLTAAGFDVVSAPGAFFLTASYERLGGTCDALSFVRELVTKKKVAAIPVSVFYREAPSRLPWIRFTFCKSDETIDTAIKNLSE